jgi:hypothetical protein
MGTAARRVCNLFQRRRRSKEPTRHHEEPAVRHVIEPSLAVLSAPKAAAAYQARREGHEHLGAARRFFGSRWLAALERAPRMCRRASLPTVVPTRSSRLQRLLWWFDGR